MLVRPDMLRMQGAFTYGPEHPFVDALQNGQDALMQFYKDHRPANIAEYYGIVDVGQPGANLPAWEMPWYKRQKRTPPPGELGLGADQGLSFYGPVTPTKLTLEMKRLEMVSASIKKHGYDPDAMGDIEGYVMRSGDKACFFVRGGKHRTAALTHLGYDYIPVVFRRTFPRIVDENHAAFWPLVLDGSIGVGLAQEILRAYTDGLVHRGN